MNFLAMYRFSNPALVAEYFPVKAEITLESRQKRNKKNSLHLSRPLRAWKVITAISEIKIRRDLETNESAAVPALPNWPREMLRMEKKTDSPLQ